ncbi:uncharacterized protein LOC110378640 [Helicoverpa armigera]|uniref:uncharacterized protein LOC110378640 n=1 Tax=Helicoverpa armigera TaxID=29058 RepID=UPI003083E275
MLKFLQFSFLLFVFFIEKCSSYDQLADSKRELLLISQKSFIVWPNATIPFYIHPEHFDHEQSMAIMTALSMFAFKTCLKFAPVMVTPDDNQHIMTFINPVGARRCKIHNEGHSNYHPHLIQLGYGCLQSPEIDMMIMRALGMPFEHNRMNRDAYIDVLVENIEPSYVELFTKSGVLPSRIWSLPYDVNSVMHFGEREYSKNGHRTIMFKDNIKQNRVGLSPLDLKKIELIYGPECRARDRQEKVELCQSYPGVARRKREVEPPTNKSLRVNPEITPPPTVLSSQKVQPMALAEAVPIEETPQDGSEYINANLDALGISNETEKIIEQVYKVSALALKHAREKYCNKTSNTTVEVDDKKPDNVKRSNASDILGILEVIADYAKSMVDNAVANLTSFCETSESIETYQRQCKFGYDSRCPKTYRSTKSGAVRYSTNHRPYIKQQTRHEGVENRYSYDKMHRREGDDTTPSLTPNRKKRDVTNPEEDKLKAVNELTEVQIENTTNDMKVSTTEDDKKAERRFFEETRYNNNKKKYRKDGAGPEWDGSDVSIEPAERMGKIAKDDSQSAEDSIDAEAEKSINKEELVKEVINEGLDSILDAEKAKNEEEEGSSSVSEPDNKEEKKSEEEEPVKKKKHRKVTGKKVTEATKTEPDEKPKMSSMEQRSHSGLPKTVRLNKLNKEFYAERKWPDGIVRLVIKKIPEFDLEDLRNRIAEVNSILQQKTCVKIHEVDSKEARGYDDYIILDTSPDYVTGRTGGKQIFGCVELFRGGQHRQHTAMMVMAMLGFYFEVSRHDRDKYIRVHQRHVRPDKLHHFEKIRDEATLDVPYDYKSATHPAWQFWRKIGKTGISTVATYKERDPDGSIMRSLGQNEELLSEYDIIKINSIYGVDCFIPKKDQAKRKRHRVKSKRNT